MFDVFESRRFALLPKPIYLEFSGCKTNLVVETQNVLCILNTDQTVKVVNGHLE